MILNILNLTIYDWLLVIGLVILLAIQLVALLKKKASKIKIGLNLLLWFCVCMLVINPSWTKSVDMSKILIYGEDISNETIQKTKDSLRIGEVFSQKEFNRRVNENADFASKLGKIYLKSLTRKNQRRDLNLKQV
jgi:hypothetical protein